MTRKLQEKVKANIIEDPCKEYDIEKKISYRQKSRLFQQERQEMLVLTAVSLWDMVMMTEYVHTVLYGNACNEKPEITSVCLPCR